MAQYVATSKESLNTFIARAKRNQRPFYIGVAGKHGPSASDAVRHRDSGGHHADQAVGSLPHNVYHTRLMRKDNACTLEDELIGKHGQDKLCVNKKSGQKQCIRANWGTVYVRIY